MSKAVQLKKKASEFEQKKQYDRALAMYTQAIETANAPDEIDIPVYNRVGDLHLRLGNLEQAVTYYEMAVDLYSESGFFNNAIALCNKVLRHAPSRSAIYYKLGKISAKKGFNSDAKQNFLEYADRMQQAGEINEAFRALKEFADLCPGQDDVRLMLADQLARAGRSEEALEQLHIVYDVMIAEDRTTEAVATLERMRALDPTVQPKRHTAQRPEKRTGLVFIDTNDEVPPTVPAGAGVQPPSIPGTDPPVSPTPARDELFETTAFPQEPLFEMPLSIVDEPTTFVPEPAMDAVPIVESDEAPSLDGDPLADAAAEGGHTFEDDGGYFNEAAAPEQLQTTVFPQESFFSAEPPGESLAIDLAVVNPIPVVDPPHRSPADMPGSGVPPRSTAPMSSDDEFVDLQAWLQETELPKNPRMTASHEEPPPGTIQTDFTEMLDMFKRGVAENVDESDTESHYDLGVAYMEMGLFEEAIAQFQKAMRGHGKPDRRVRVYESLGRCFIEQGQYDVAIASLDGALHEPGLTDGTLVGVLYLLGVASEALPAWRDATAYYKRVFAVDINFRDIGERLRRATRTSAMTPLS